MPKCNGVLCSGAITVLFALIFFSACTPDMIPDSAVKIPIIAFANAACVCLCTFKCHSRCKIRWCWFGLYLTGSRLPAVFCPRVSSL